MVRTSLLSCSGDFNPFEASAWASVHDLLESELGVPVTAQADRGTTTNEAEGQQSRLDAFFVAGDVSILEDTVLGAGATDQYNANNPSDHGIVMMNCEFQQSQTSEHTRVDP